MARSSRYEQVRPKARQLVVGETLADRTQCELAYARPSDSVAHPPDECRRSTDLGELGREPPERPFLHFYFFI
jgi:hypothetical protein